MERKKKEEKKKAAPAKKKEEKKNLSPSKSKGKASVKAEVGDVTTAVKAANKAMEKMGEALVPKQKWDGVGIASMNVKINVEIDIKFWNLIPSLNLNFHTGLATVEIEFLCFGLYFDFGK